MNPLSKNPPLNPPLSGEIKSSVAVIGGGMAGLSCAQKLHSAGIETVLIEQDFCGAGASGKSSGFITPDSEIELSSLLENYGPEKAKRIWSFVISGLENIRNNITQNKFDCDYQVQDSLFIANSASGFKHVQKEHEARKKLGYSSQLYEAKSTQKIIGSQGYKGAVRYPETFGINSYAYCQELKNLLQKSGLKIYEKTRADHIEGHQVFTSNGRITADHIILCGDRFIPDLGILKKEIYHVQTFLGLTKPLSHEQAQNIFPTEPMMVWDSNLVYNYFRITGERRLLVGGGDLFYTYAHELSKNTQRFEKRLKSYMHKKFPSLDLEFEEIRPGMLGVSKDLLPIIGPDANNKNIWIVGAASGLPWAAALGVYAAEKILNNRDDFDTDFSWKRDFVIGARLQSLLGTPTTYALSHGIAKYC